MVKIPGDPPGNGLLNQRKRPQRRRSSSKRVCESRTAGKARRTLSALAFLFGAVMVLAQNEIYASWSLAIVPVTAFVMKLVADYFEKKMKRRMTGDVVLSIALFILLGFGTASAVPELYKILRKLPYGPPASVAPITTSTSLYGPTLPETGITKDFHTPSHMTESSATLLPFPQFRRSVTPLRQD